MVINTITVVIIIMSYVIISYRLSKKLNFERYNSIMLCGLVLYHISCSVFFWYLNCKNTSDSMLFFLTAKEADNWIELFRIGGDFISFLIYPLTKIGLSYLTITIVFSLISFLGYYVYIQFFFKDHFQRPLTTILLFLMYPSIHYWTGGISKEVLVFTFMAIIIQKITLNKIKNIWVLFSLMIILLNTPLYFSSNNYFYMFCVF